MRKNCYIYGTSAKIWENLTGNIFWESCMSFIWNIHTKMFDALVTSGKQVLTLSTVIKEKSKWFFTWGAKVFGLLRKHRYNNGFRRNRKLNYKNCDNHKVVYNVYLHKSLKCGLYLNNVRKVQNVLSVGGDDERVSMLLLPSLVFFRN